MKVVDEMGRETRGESCFVNRKMRKMIGIAWSKVLEGLVGGSETIFSILLEHD
jgi:hypothetical protein